jgi:hypothetical protein
MPASSVPGRAVSIETLGAWLVKRRGEASADVVGSRFETLTGCCVRAGYRADLVRDGQLVLLWVSGNDPERPAGIYAQGTTTGRCLPEDPVGGGAPVMPVRLVPLDPPVLREQVMAVPGLAGLEVVRMAAGSNPSYLDVAQLHALAAAFPEIATGSEAFSRPGMATGRRRSGTSLKP